MTIYFHLIFTAMIHLYLCIPRRIKLSSVNELIANNLSEEIAEMIESHKKTQTIYSWINN